MKKGVVAVIVLAAVAAAAGGTYEFYLKDHWQIVEEKLAEIKEKFGIEDDSPMVFVTSVSEITGYGSAGMINRYAGVVEPQNTLEIKLESNRVVKEIKVKVGDEVKQGQLLFVYDLSSIESQLQEEQLAMERLKNEAISLTEQISTLEKEKAKANQDSQLSYTIEIETDKMNLKKNEYDQKSQQAKIDRLQNATGNTEVRSDIDGIIQKIDTSQMTTDDSASITDTLDESGGYYDASGGSGAFITILSTGAYRVKGKVNELNINSIVTGEPVIIRSRVDEAETWAGTMGTIDRENADKDTDSNSYWGMSSSDSLTNSSTYPFYVELDSSDGLMLGQHVYIEPDNGQEEQKDGLWLSEFYIVDADTAEPYVWAANASSRLEKRKLVLGEYDEALGEYEILDGLTLKDYITFPEDSLEEGMRTTTDADEAYSFDDEAYTDESYDDLDWEDGSYSDDLGDVAEDDSDAYEDYDEYEEYEDYDPDEEIIGDEEVVEEYYIIDENGNEIPVTADELFADMPDDEDMPIIDDEMTEG